MRTGPGPWIRPLFDDCPVAATNEMSTTATQSAPTLGFLTVCEHEGGLFGGYLVLNTNGRPLEFHCTAPVRPNRAQVILYGPTLKPYLYGEQIGQALLEKAKSQPLLIFTDAEAVLAVRDFIEWPVVYVPTAEPDPPPAALEAVPSGLRVDAAHAPSGAPHSAKLHQFHMGPQPLAVLPNHADDEPEIVRRWQPYCADFDVQEPFGRIREAIDEARRSVRQP